MSNLFILNETFTNGFNYNLLTIIAFAIIICYLMAATTPEYLISLLFLIGLFLNLGGFLMMLGIKFIGLSYLLVYVGAVSILFSFILMLMFDKTLCKLLPSRIAYFNTPPKPYGFANAPTESGVSIWTALFGAGAIYTFSGVGNVYGRDALPALGVYMLYPGCSIGDGLHSGAIHTISVLNSKWYHYEYCIFAMRCLYCDLEVTSSPILSLLVKYNQMNPLGF